MSELFRAKVQGGVFIPFRRHQNFVSAHFEDGETVFLEVQKERSIGSHKHQFAWLREAFQNLPDDLKDLPYAASEEALRKHALIKTGFCDTKTVDAGTHAAAERVAAYARQVEFEAHGYAIVIVRGPVVHIATPHSQSMSRMGKEVFEKSKQAILNWIAELLHVKPEDLEKAESA